MNWRGEEIPLAKLLAHYRLQARNDPHSASFWRARLRAAIAEHREQIQ